MCFIVEFAHVKVQTMQYNQKLHDLASTVVVSTGCDTSSRCDPVKDGHLLASSFSDQQPTHPQIHQL